MKELYLKSLQMIKELNIKTEKEYISIIKEKFALLLPSLQYISCTNDFNKIIKLSKEIT